MKKKKILLFSLFALVLIGCSVFFILNKSNASTDNARPSVKVLRGDIIDKALAIGTIEPKIEISVKSQLSGVVHKQFADAGDFVKAGAPLLEIKPNPTPTELVDAKRQVEMREIAVTNLKPQLDRQKQLLAQKLISTQDFESALRNYDESALQVQMAKERLALLESGKVGFGKNRIETIIKAPIDGFILNKAVEIGDPVTPLTSYQEGTVLMKIADMNSLLLKGTVDEIDVGKLKEGMDVQIKVGALPNDTIKGKLKFISLKANKKDNSTVFPIEIEVPKAQNAKLRAGYSANANIIIQKKEKILMLPERVVTFRNDSAFVLISTGDKKEEEKNIKTGLSDAINVEVISGLKEGDSVLEKPMKMIQ